MQQDSLRLGLETGMRAGFRSDSSMESFFNPAVGGNATPPLKTNKEEEEFVAVSG